MPGWQESSTYSQPNESDIEINNEFIPGWSYPDLTAQTEQLLKLIIKTIEHDMAYQFEVNAAWRSLMDDLKAMIDTPDENLSSLARSIAQNEGALSNKILKQNPALLDESLAEDIVERIMLWHQNAPVEHPYDEDDVLENLMKKYQWSRPMY